MTAMTLRLPDELHESLRVQAFNERTTITALILSTLKSRPKSGLACDEQDCWDEPTRVVSGGFHFCREHGPRQPVEDDFGDGSIQRAMIAARDRGEDIENMPNPSRLRGSNQ